MDSDKKRTSPVDTDTFTPVEYCIRKIDMNDELTRNAEIRSVALRDRIDNYLEKAKSGRNVAFYNVPMTDRYRDEKFSDSKMYISELESMGFYGTTSTDFSRDRSKIDHDNPATKKLCADREGFQAWMNTIPQAEALKVLEDPEMETLPDGSPLSEEARELFRNSLDAIGIRSRAEIVKGAIVEHIMNRQEGDKTAELHATSLACGTAGTVFDALQQLKSHGYAAPHVSLLDYDPSALKFAEERAIQDGYDSVITTSRQNILHPDGLVGEKINNNLSRGCSDVVDLVGFLEYLKKEDKKYVYNGVISERSKQAGAVTMLANAYKLVKPGGIMVFGNMHDERDQKSFLADVIQWPHIQPRSMEQCLELLDEAGIVGDVDVYYPADGVYAVYVVKKSRFSR